LSLAARLATPPGQSSLHASGPAAFAYLMLTGIAANRSESRTSLRIGHQSYKKISRGGHMETQPPIVRLSRTISPIRLPFIKAARKLPNQSPTLKQRVRSQRWSGPHGTIRVEAARSSARSTWLAKSCSKRLSIELLLVKTSDYRRQTTKRPDQLELCGNDRNDEAESRLMC
jgi:hypothetical protein